MSEIKDSQRIKLNVGGLHYETTFGTVKNAEMLKVWISRWSPSEELFIDKSGAIFEHVLNFLRNPLYYYPEEHLEELKYYGIFTTPTNINDTMSKTEYCYKAVKQIGKLCAATYCLSSKQEKLKYCNSCGDFVIVEKKLAPGDIVMYEYGYYFVSYIGPYVAEYDSLGCKVNMTRGNIIKRSLSKNHTTEIINDGYCSIDSFHSNSERYVVPFSAVKILNEVEKH